VVGLPSVSGFACGFFQLLYEKSYNNKSENLGYPAAWEGLKITARQKVLFFQERGYNLRGSMGIS
jgi:hypothetical protein